MVKVAVLYALIGALHWLCRRPFFLISTDPAPRVPRGLARPPLGLPLLRLVRRRGDELGPDRAACCSSSRISSSRRWPACSSAARLATRLLVGWGFGTAVSVLAVTTSAALDLPTGATVVCVFGVSLAVLWATALGIRRR